MQSDSQKPAQLPTANAAKHRLALQAELKSSLFPKISRELGAKAAAIQLARDIFGPAIPLEHGHICDTLCAMLDTPVGTMAIFHARRSQAGPEGIGRTSLLLRYLGIRLVCTFRRICAEDILAAPKVRLEFSDELPRALVSSDFAYLWSDSGRLNAIPPLGEPFLGVWDLARHIFRRMDPKYFPGKRGTREGRQILHALLEALPAVEFLSCYSLSDAARRIELAVVLEIADCGEAPVEIPIRSIEDRCSSLRTAFESVLYLSRTPFWERDDTEHKQIVDRIVAKLRQPPELIHILVPPALIVAGEEEFLTQTIYSFVVQKVLTMKAR